MNFQFSISRVEYSNTIPKAPVYSHTGLRVSHFPSGREMTVNIDVLFVGKQYERTRRAGIGGLTFYAAVSSGKTTTGYLVISRAKL